MKIRKETIAGYLALLAIVLLLGPAAPSILAQAGRGTISGTITDPSGAIVPGATVTLLNPATGVSLHTKTTAAGLYTFISLNPGTYQVTASLTGFTTAVRENVSV